MYNALFNDKYQKWELVYIDDSNDDTKIISSGFISPSFDIVNKWVQYLAYGADADELHLSKIIIDDLWHFKNTVFHEVAM